MISTYRDYLMVRSTRWKHLLARDETFFILAEIVFVKYSTLAFVYLYAYVATYELYYLAILRMV